MSDADLQRAAQALARARERITTLERARAAPVAIVGVGLRLPGDIDTPDALWSALCERRDLTGPVPEDMPFRDLSPGPAPIFPPRSPPFSATTMPTHGSVPHVA